HDQPALAFHQRLHATQLLRTLKRNDFSSNRHRALNFLLEHDPCRNRNPLFGIMLRRQASSRLNTTDALVPPNPNELDSTQPSSTSSRRSRTIGTSANAGSRVSMLALSQMKPLFIISIE